ncbi:flagellar basal body P-ring formation chaperone FlgA [Defluviimonas sp. WL0002]|uniref:Flagella basal body P-ring formation protein FlgA n=1 Tax=Albidovulum marisflavi TaxID=2984159 RepID=A0ABT2Z7D9_9RHOB|nr:flagellar basal body P-ring formation chaperone FlgA [Defluviimonas sp. WL0002]MCV2867058.1 flagellar basal body P-ring formation chaperone FlgA [Defluviimonas sp. WL0002]
MRRVLLAIMFAAQPGLAETAIAARTIPARAMISADDVISTPDSVPGGAKTDDAIGQEARVTMFRGQPVLIANLVTPALVQRNQPVRLHYRSGGLTISAEGRSLDRAALGETVRALTSSRSIVTGQVLRDGSVQISAND